MGQEHEYCLCSQCMVPVDCFYDTNHVIMGHINVEKWTFLFPYIYTYMTTCTVVLEKVSCGLYKHDKSEMLPTSDLVVRL